ncbi:MAG: hypothetical protein CVV39_00475 [Planctomycetes bacterium HGW-Planctomycetes-1]|nr:MAG: hypothetical protein CVV39_00475 [Planctomycetes bacterium HGW-Planctomycetes-1]
MSVFLTISGSLLFIASAAAHIYVRVKLRPKQGSDFDDIYWEFEDTHPGFAKYSRLLQITFAGIVIGTLLLFLALVF